MIEAAVALVLLGMVVMLAWLAVASSSKASLTGRSRVLATVELAALDQRLRAASARVRVPLWQEGSDFIELGASEARVSYLDGSPEARLIVSSDDEGVLLELPEGRVRFGRLRLSGLSAATAADGGVYGLACEVSGSGSAPSRIVASFGALPW